MKICSYLKSKQVLLDLKAENKTSLLQELASFLQERGIIKDERRVYEELLKREGLGSTALSEGIAVPHALLPSLKSPVVALALSRKGVDFGDKEGKPTHVFLILLGSKESPGKQLKILAHVCRLIKETNFVSRIKKIKAEQEACYILEEEERKIE